MTAECFLSERGLHEWQPRSAYAASTKSRIANVVGINHRQVAIVGQVFRLLNVFQSLLTCWSVVP
jgi:hypothetical protein